METILILIAYIAYVIFCLVNGRKIKKELKAGNDILIAILLMAIVVLSYIKERNIIITCITTLASLLYFSLPSGYTNDAFYIRGIKYSFRHVNNLQLFKLKDKMRIVIVYKIRPYSFICDYNDKEVLKELEKLTEKEFEYHD